MSNINSLVFISNYFNHHQKPVSDELFLRLGEGYTFVETSPITEERKAMGWGYDDLPSYVIKAYEKKQEDIISLVTSADVVIVGGALDEYVKERKKQKKIVVRYSERPLKNGIEPSKFLLRLIKWHMWNPNKCPIYMLCSSAYTAGDYHRFHLFDKKCYRWGYFPPFVSNNIDELINKKQSDCVSLLFVSRLIALKHPEYPLEAIKRLRDEGIAVKLTIVGRGELEEYVRKFIDDNCLHERVSIIPVLAPEEVRRLMDNSDILMLTSNKVEGWGAVVNEAMNSGCVVIGSSEIGSIPFLIENGTNGCIYEGGNFDSFYQNVRRCCIDESMRKKMGRAAYETISTLWNPKNAAERLLLLFDDLMKMGYSERFQNGPCSQAPILNDGWFKDEQ